MDPKNRMEELTRVLQEANYRYYVLDDPNIQDFEYDALLHELETLEEQYPEYKMPDSPTQHVGGAAQSQFEKVQHPVPLMSLQDVFSVEELEDFLHTLPLEDNNAVSNLCCRLCSAYEHKAFRDGLQYGAHLMQEIINS